MSFLDLYTRDSEAIGLRTSYKKNSSFLITKKAILPISKAKEENLESRSSDLVIFSL